MRGKWAQGIEPRHFTWVLKNQMAVCERPGGHGSEHRKVRLQQELVWIRKQGFVVVSLSDSEQNLRNYAEMGVRCRHVRFDGPDAGPAGLVRALGVLRSHLKAGDQLLVHRDLCDECLMGLMAAYLRWTSLVPSDLEALTVAEHLFGRELGQPAREIVALVDKCPPPQIPASPQGKAGDG